MTTTTSYDDMGRAWKVTLLDGTSTTDVFYVTGHLQKTSGSRTYPVEYTHDSQGWMQTMKTWQSVSGGTYAITTWNYDGARGWLAAKDCARSTWEGPRVAVPNIWDGNMPSLPAMEMAAISPPSPATTAGSDQT
jgi:hypothetical protein